MLYTTLLTIYIMLIMVIILMQIVAFLICNSLLLSTLLVVSIFFNTPGLVNQPEQSLLFRNRPGIHLVHSST